MRHRSNTPEPETTADKALAETEEEARSVSAASPLNARLVFDVIRQRGLDELGRPFKSLFWSGITAGILISFSVLGEAYLRAWLPATGWRYLVENLGYSLGFLLVILGRMQLFTENTITTVIPVAMSPRRNQLLRLVRLWTIVLGANVIGAFIAATFLAYGGTLDADVGAIVADLSHHATGMGATQSLMRGIPAGILIAAIVWMMPSAKSSELPLIVIFTWLIAVGDFTHVVAGSVEMAYLLVLGDLGPGQAVGGFFLPVLAGNVIGGTVVFTMLAWAQIAPEVEETE